MNRKLPDGHEQYPPSEQIQMLLRDLEQATIMGDAWKSMYETTIALDRQAEQYRIKYGCERCQADRQA